MKPNEEKIALYQAAIRQETDKKIAVIEQEIAQYEAETMAQAKEVAQEESFVFMQAKVKVIKAKHLEEVTRAKIAGKKKLLLYRNELAEQMFAELKTQLLAFTNTPEYQAFLFDRLKYAVGAFPYDNISVWLKPDDLKFAPKIKEQFPKVCDVQSDARVVMGGFFLWSAQRRVLLDSTIASMLEEQKIHFYRDSGLILD